VSTLTVVFGSTDTCRVVVVNASGLVLGGWPACAGGSVSVEDGWATGELAAPGGVAVVECGG
jgi:hypothetical protein